MPARLAHGPGRRAWGAAALALTAIIALPLGYTRVAGQAAGTAAPAAAEPIDYDAIYKIKDEAINRSQVMDTLSYLTDVYGPRLTNSPNMPTTIKLFGVSTTDPGYRLVRSRLATCWSVPWSDTRTMAVRVTTSVPCSDGELTAKGDEPSSASLLIRSGPSSARSTTANEPESRPRVDELSTNPATTLADLSFTSTNATMCASPTLCRDFPSESYHHSDPPNSPWLNATK